MYDSMHISALVLGWSAVCVAGSLYAICAHSDCVMLTFFANRRSPCLLCMLSAASYSFRDLLLAGSVW